MIEITFKIYLADKEGSEAFERGWDLLSVISSDPQVLDGRGRIERLQPPAAAKVMARIEKKKEKKAKKAAKNA